VFFQPFWNALIKRWLERPPPAQPRLVGEQAVAKALCIPVKKVRELRADRGLPYVHLPPRTYRYDLAEVMAWARSHRDWLDGL
jgi:hypothetical protein